MIITDPKIFSLGIKIPVFFYWTFQSKLFIEQEKKALKYLVFENSARRDY